MRRFLIFFFPAFLMLGSSVAFGFHDSMPEGVHTRLQGFGVTFIEYDGPVLRKDNCPNVRRTLLKTSPLGKSRGVALFVSEEDGTSNRLLGAEIRDDKGELAFVWRSSDFWQVAACHFPNKYGGRDRSPHSADAAE